MAKKSGQLETVSFIRRTLTERGFSIPCVAGENGWLVFGRKGRSIAVDKDSGIWLRDSNEGGWRRLSESGLIGAALEAVEFLIKD